MLPNFSQLIDLLKNDLKASRNIPNHWQAQFCWDEPFDPLTWLDAQPLYPKCFWQSRSGTKTVLALGAVAAFDCAQQALQGLQGTQRVWGGRPFAQKQAPSAAASDFFFLPLLEVICDGGQWLLQLNLQTELADVQAALDALNFAPPALASLDCEQTALSHTPNETLWSEMVNRALQKMALSSANREAKLNSALQKVVLARKTTASFSNKINPFSLLAASQKINLHHFHFLLAKNADSVFVGSTPERLFARDGSALFTEALAGTCARGKDQHQDEQLAQWLQRDKKNSYENQLVVNDIVARLAGKALLSVAPAQIIKLAHVQHLKCAMSGVILDSAEINDSRLLDLLQPTAAVAGLPRAAALEHIMENEPFDRGWYSGSVGFMRPERSEFCVAIRSALVEGDVVHFFAGAGIVPGSIASAEWQELDKKLATLLALLEPAQC
ncbi:MAG: isochorismate synthase [Enterovibrio sp.]